jgi:hypothetical protein
MGWQFKFKVEHFFMMRFTSFRERFGELSFSKPSFSEPFRYYRFSGVAAAAELAGGSSQP